MPRSFLRTVSALILSSSLAALPAPAQPGATNDVAPAAAPQATVDMSLEQAVALAIQKNFDIKIQQYSVADAKESVTIARSQYDPTLTASTNHTYSQATNVGSKIEGSRSEGATATAGVSEQIPTGGTVSLSTNLLNRSQSNNPTNTFNPQFTSGVTLSVTQPLLRGFGFAYNLANIRIAVIGLDIANLNYKGRVLDTIQSVENAYANLVSARDALDVRRFSLKLAETSDSETRERKKAGLLTDLDVYNSEYNVVSSRNNVLQAEQAVRAQEDVLRNLLGGETFDVAIVPTTGIATSNVVSPGVNHAYDLALGNQTNRLAMLASIKQTELNVTVAKKNRLPSLGVTGSLGYNGRDQSFQGAWTQTSDRGSYSWNLGLNLSLPWGIRADNARYRTALNNLSTAQLQLRQFDQSLLVQVRSAVRTLEFNIESVRLSSLASELSQKKYDFEKARYDVGQSTARDLLQAQSDLESARLSELQARVSLTTALTALQRLEGLTLERYHITVPEQKP